MICTYCQREVPDDGLFCPYCGKNIKGPKIPTVRNKDLIAILPFELFEKEFNELKKMGAKEAFSWYKGRHEPIEVFYIEVEYMYYPHNADGQPIPNRSPEKRTGRFSTTVIDELFKNRKEYKALSIRPVKKHLRSSDLNHDKGIGFYFFFYEKDAKKAIADIEAEVEDERED